ncbi:lysine--tRNA ligase [Bacillus gaemokensis]|uniref:lysine--tRNA ligase n=1 Tax=Bacillus gaemokensis TaxID=574375 RepID=UPI0022367DF9|nr:lysine--tRNA ligase [Bacillus gaemokensis]
MKTIIINQYGGIEQLQEGQIQKPIPKTNEVLIQIHAAAVNPVDWKIRKGELQEKLPFVFPIILGLDVAGVIEEVGAGVKHFKPGDKVYTKPENIGKDSTTIIRFDEPLGKIHYKCECGNLNELSVLQTNRMKLNWKIDWPMRWMMEDVVFEPGGRDHSAETGSYNVSKEIARKIFNYEEPHYIAYDFIGIKGDNQKMSSSAGNIITPNELLQVYLPEVILFMFSKYKPSAAFHIGLDEDVIRNYTEYERYIESYRNKVLNNEDLCNAIKLSRTNDGSTSLPKFSQAAGVLPLVNFDTHVLQEVLAKTDRDYNLIDIMKISNRVEYWIRNLQPQKKIAVNQEKNWEFYETLEDVQKKWVSKVYEMLRTNADHLNVMEQIYAICHNENKKIMKENQKLLFSIIYRLVINKSNGPRIPLLIQVIGVEAIVLLLDFRN